MPGTETAMEGKEDVYRGEVEDESEERREKECLCVD